MTYVGKFKHGQWWVYVWRQYSRCKTAKCFCQHQTKYFTVWTKLTHEYCIHSLVTNNNSYCYYQSTGYYPSNGIQDKVKTAGQHTSFLLQQNMLYFHLQECFQGFIFNCINNFQSSGTINFEIVSHFHSILYIDTICTAWHTAASGNLRWINVSCADFTVSCKSTCHWYDGLLVAACWWRWVIRYTCTTIHCTACLCTLHLQQNMQQLCPWRLQHPMQNLRPSANKRYKLC